jgi:hypothetical protein
MFAIRVAAVPKTGENLSAGEELRRTLRQWGRARDVRMSTFLFAVGGLMLGAGLVIIGLGTPASALNFGNTLILAGTTAAVGGLIVIALGAVVGQLQRIGEALGANAAGRDEHIFAVAPERRAPAAPQPFEPRGPTPPAEFPMAQPSFAPSLPNPEEFAAQPRQPDQVASAARQPKPDERPASRADHLRQGEPRRGETGPSRSTATTLAVAAEEAGTSVAAQEAEAVSSPLPPEPPAVAPPAAEQRAALPPKSPFDSLWPAAPRPPENLDPPEPPPAAIAPDTPRELETSRRVAVLKSGVVDGMSYTLYVDGSIEAELPQGTLRFANIQELRAHLEKNG